jgi:uncharacterized protein with GYD domain
LIFITYWELNPEFDPSEMAEMAQELMSKKIFPAEGINQKGFYVSTGDYWGITIDEAESEEILARSANMWRVAKPGYIKFMKTTPAMDVAKAIPIMMKLKKQIKG